MGTNFVFCRQKPTLLMQPTLDLPLLASHGVAPLPCWELAMLNDDDLLVEKRGHSSLTEPLVSA
jgi:hypothetical protein